MSFRLIDQEKAHHAISLLWAGWRYLAVVLDLFTRRVVGWAMADHPRAELVIDALDMASGTADPTLGWCTPPIRAAHTPR